MVKLIKTKKSGKLLAKNCGAACLVFFLALALAACGISPAERDFFAMDTYIEIQAYGKNAEGFLTEANTETIRLENLLSAHSEKSELNALNSGKTPNSPELLNLAGEAVSLADLTGGAFDPTVLPLVELWGFGDEMRVPKQSEIDAALETVGYGKLRSDGNKITLNGTRLDLGGIAKGYAADRFGLLAAQHGVDSAFASFGGMVAAVGQKPGGKPWRVGVKDPRSDGLAAVLEVRDTCVSTSGGYERYFTHEGKIYHHILDPKTGYPAESDLLSATVVDPSGTRADALSTALYVMGKDRAIEFCKENQICAILITENELIPLSGADRLISEISQSYELIKE